MTPSTRRRWFMYACFAGVLATVYFGNVAIQTRLGKKALAQTGLPHYELDQALTMAQQQSKWVLADLSAIWCPACRKLDSRVFSNEKVKETLGKSFIFARIEYESPAGKAFQKRYQVQGFPTLLVLNSKGELVKQLPVTFDPQEFITMLEQL